MGSTTTMEGLNCLYRLVHGHQMHLQPVQGRAGVAEFEQTLFHPLFQVDADGAHVADDLVAGLLEGEIEAALAAPAGGVDEMGGHARFAGSGGAGDQDAAPPVVAFPPSMVSRRGTPVETRSLEAGWSRPREEIGMTEKPCSSIRKGYSLVPWAEPRYLTIRMRRVAICSAHLVAEKDHAVGDVLFQAEAGQGPLALLAGDDGGDALVFKKPNRRFSSARRITSLEKPEKRVSMVSSTTRLAPMVSMA